jgi:hypothetical protein
VSSTQSLNSFGATIGTQSCPAGTFAVSGGFSVNNAVTAPDMGQSFPVGGSSTSPPTGWQATDFVASIGGTLTVYAICST